MTGGRWTFEEIAPGEAHCHHVLKETYKSHTAHQLIEVLETRGYGRGLFLDGRIQHVAKDEFVYSESMIHPAMLFLEGRCDRAMCIGAGPGGVVRELLRYASVGEVAQVEIDEEVINVSRQFFRHITAGAERDPRFKLVIADALDLLSQPGERYDLIVNDVSEPTQDSPAAAMFSERTLAMVRSRLSERGLYVTWCGSVGLSSATLAARISAAVGGAFPFSYRYITHPQSYGTIWMTAIGSTRPLDPMAFSRNSVDLHITSMIGTDLSYYDGETHHNMFSIPKSVRDALASADLSAPIQLTLSAMNDAS
jgi:spermidine synthase